MYYEMVRKEQTNHPDNFVGVSDPPNSPVKPSNSPVKPGYINVRSIIDPPRSQGSLSALSDVVPLSHIVVPSHPPSNPTTPLRTPRSPPALKKIHTSAVKLHNLLGLTFTHLNECSNADELRDELLLAEGSVCSAVCRVLEEVEEVMGERNVGRSPVVLPRR